MDTKSTPAAPSGIDDLFQLTLVDGLPVESQGRTLRYKAVRLRETCVADERIAEREAERLVMVGGVHKLVVSDSAFRFAMTVQHIDRFGDGATVIARPVVDAELVGKLSSHDLSLIEKRVFLITLAAEVRYGNMSQAEFDAVMAGTAAAQQAPQPAGQAADVGQGPADAQPGPALLTDYAGKPAGSAPAGNA